jgi:mRNA degradation ribonuclease J1/J2
MGIIAKTDDTVICFDLSTVIPTPQLIDLAKTCNYLFLSHTDGDHLNALAVQEVLKNGGKVIMQDNIGIVGETIKSLTSEEQFENVSILESEKEYTINDIEIYSIQTTHRGSQEQDNTMVSVTVMVLILFSNRRWNIKR